MDLDHPEHPYEPIEHEVIIRPHGLREHCRPVRTDSWGELVEDVAKRLGAARKAGLMKARGAGVFSERSVKGLGGRHCQYPVPLIHSWKTLDPSGPVFARPDPLWGSMWEWLADMIPDDFEQTVVRRPIFRQMNGRVGEWANGREEMPQYKDEMRFWGWSWVCPACRKTVRKIYYPVAPRTVFDYLGYDPARSTKARAQSKKYLAYDVEDVGKPPGTFACGVCHGVARFTRTSAQGWNMVVSWLTRGMLYGREVEKPSWYRRERKRTRLRILGRPAVKRDAVFARMRLGWTIQQIALNLKMSKSAVVCLMHVICRLEGVKNRHELAAKLRWTHPQPLSGFEKRCQIAREREKLVEPLLALGLLYREIAQRLQMAECNVEGAAARIYRRHGISVKEGRKGFMQRFAAGVTGGASLRLGGETSECTVIAAVEQKRG